MQIECAKAKALVNLYKNHLYVQQTNCRTPKHSQPVSIIKKDGGNILVVTTENITYADYGVIQNVVRTFELRGDLRKEYKQVDRVWVNYITKPEGHAYSTDNWPTVNQVTQY